MKDLNILNIVLFYNNKNVLKIYIDIISINMQSTDTEDSQSDEQPLKGQQCGDKRPVCKPRTALWRLGEDGKYNNKPLSESYFRDYYHNKIKATVECVYCHKMTGAQKLKRHQTSKACQKFQTL